MGELRSQKQQREQLVRSLRAEGKSRVEVAEALRQRYRFNARVALRYAREWSQRRAADEWNQHWPDELKTFKSFSYWEQWPSSTGHAPTFDNLSKLAELYECAVSDLLVDLPDFRHLDTTSSTQTTVLTMPKPDAQLVTPSDFAVWATATGLALPDTFVAMLMHYLGSLAPADREVASRPGTAITRIISLFSSSAVGRTPWTVVTHCVCSPGQRASRPRSRVPSVTSMSA